MEPAQSIVGAVMIEDGPLVLFDGVCNLCSGCVRFLSPRDRTGRLRFAPIQDAVGQAILWRHNLPPQDWDSFVFLDEGQVYLKSTAVFRIVRFMRWPWTMLAALQVLPRPVTDWVYDRVARNRYAMFGRRTTCMLAMPPPTCGPDPGQADNPMFPPA